MPRITRVVFAWLMLLASAVGARAAELHPHTFEYRLPAGSPKPKTVHVAGTFNGWNNAVTPMTDDDGDGVYVAKVQLPEGVHHYKFVVDGSTWLTDPRGDAALEQPDNYGGNNSGVLVGPDARKAPPPKPDHINAGYVIHNPEDPADADNLGDGRVRVRVRVLANDLTSVTVHGANGGPSQRLWRSTSKNGFDVYSGFLAANGKPDLKEYLFALEDRGTIAYLGANHVVPMDEASALAHFLVPRPRVVTPDWAKHAVWYQIFPERFRNGDPANDPPKAFRWQSNWWDTLPGETERLYNEVWFRRFGGDLQGVREQLPYLRSLGVNALYFNPIFEAESVHKYDAADYRHVDDNFGFKGDLAELSGETDDPATWKWSKTDRLFLDFVQDAHRQGFKVVLDGVFNHVGREHYAFQDVLKNGRKSKYADWFEITDFGPPVKYKAWDGDNGSLPVFKKDPARGLAPGPREHVLAITKRWLAPDGDPSKGIDGWRLDVPGDIPHPFWVEFRQVVKSTKPDAYVVGEIWQMAQPWLKGDQFDAVMNYPFAALSREFFADQKTALAPSKAASRLSELAEAYAFQVALVQQNLLDSHDTDRFASMFVNPDLPYDRFNRIQDSGPKYNPAKPTVDHWTRMRQALVLQFTYAGAPMVYYGDEAGMWSPDDPSNRMPMVWKDLEPYDDVEVKFDANLFAHYRRLIAVRSVLPALRLGLYRTLLADDAAGVLAFARELGDARAYVVINRGAGERTVRVPIGDEANDAKLVDWLDPSQVELLDAPAGASDGRPTLKLRDDVRRLTPTAGTLELRLPAYGSAVLAPAH